MTSGEAALSAAMPASACDYLAQTLSAQSAGPRLLASFPGESSGPLSQAAFTYDNSVAAIALVACGQVGLARRVGDALLLALEHDRYWHDGRLRNGYAAGVVGIGPIKLAGWWDTKSRRWLEDGYQAGSDSGNMAWAMLALLTLDAASGDRRYRSGALRLAQWVDGTFDRRGSGGFSGGSFGHEPSPQRLSWRSTEHNTDLVAAFSWMARSSGDPHWQQRAALAARFVIAMWDSGCGCFAVGTGEDGITRNPLLALDAQIWPLLALPRAATQYSSALAVVEHRLRFGDGYTYSQAGGGLWTEGTAQVAVLLQLLHRDAPARALLTVIDGQRTPNGGFYASDVAATPTGFTLATDPSKPRLYFHLEHLGAAAWAALAEQRFDPFTGTRALPP